MDKFQELVNQLPVDKKCIQSAPGTWSLPLGYCFFGVPQSDFFGWASLHEIPATCHGFHFYLGGTPLDLITAFSKSTFPEQIELLVIGDSSYAAGMSLDYSNLVRALQNVKFPNLKELQLGVWELFSNEHCMYGKVGDVTNILMNTPKLRKLGLYGQFELSAPISCKDLKELTIELEDSITGFGGGFVSNKTFSNLLDSAFPSLEQIVINLSCEDDTYGYRFNEHFLSGINIPSIKRLEIAGGFAEGEKEKLQSSPIYKKKDVLFYLDGMLIS